jgi:hypothetical protein
MHCLVQYKKRRIGLEVVNSNSAIVVQTHADFLLFPPAFRWIALRSAQLASAGTAHLAGCDLRKL